MSKSEQMVSMINGAQWRFGEDQTSLPATKACPVIPNLRPAVGGGAPAGQRIA
jgi:hypothetical protein